MRSVGSALFPWDNCGQPLFDRIVEALLTEAPQAIVACSRPWTGAEAMVGSIWT